MKNLIENSIENCIEAVKGLKQPFVSDFIDHASRHLAHVFKEERKVLIAGNGGSLCDAMHFAEELTGYFRSPRQALPAIALTDPGHLTCVANDTGFENVFARSVEALGQAGDVLIVLSTSGNSLNLIQAIASARRKNMSTMALLGRNGGLMHQTTDLELLIPGVHSDRIQEVHMAVLHMIVEMVEHLLWAPQENEVKINSHSKAQEVPSWVDL